MGDPIFEAAARKGSAELLILAALEDGQLHGYDIAREIARRSDGLLDLPRRVAVPAALQARGSRLDCRALGGKGRPAPAAMLPTDGRRPARAGRRSAAAGPHSCSRSPRPRDSAMRDWLADVRERLARDAGAPPLPREVVEEVAQHIADAHRDALLSGRSSAEIDAASRANSPTSGSWPTPSPGGSVRRARAGRTGDARVRRASGAIRHTRGDCSAHDAATPPWSSSRWRSASARARRSSASSTRCCSDRCRIRIPIASCCCGKRTPGIATRTFIVAAPNYRDWVRETQSFAALGIWEHLTFNVSATAEPEQVPGIRASSSLFDVLGVAPALGRAFHARRRRTGPSGRGHHRRGVARAFRSRRRTWSGEPIRLNGAIHEVIGVMPPGFDVPGQGTGVWMPIASPIRIGNAARIRSYVAGRLRDDVTFDQARDDVGTARRERCAERYEENADEGATVSAHGGVRTVNVRRILVALSGAVALVLLIACVNVASLQLALGLTRRREFVMRLALGATYRHLARQMFVRRLARGGPAAARPAIALAWRVTRASRCHPLARIPQSSLPRRRPCRRSTPASSSSPSSRRSRPRCSSHLRRSSACGDRRCSRCCARATVARRASPQACAARSSTAEIALAIVVLSSAGLMIRSLTTLLARASPGSTRAMC